MRRTTIALLVGTALTGACFAQTSGNAIYGQVSGKDRAEQNERSKRIVAKDEMPPDRFSQYIDASVLMNVKADEYVAVFGISEDGASAQECSRKTDATIAEFAAELRKLGVQPEAISVDFAVQNRIYSYEVAGDIAKEKPTGFEQKSNVSVHYKEQAVLDKLVLAAASADIHDLIKVDYIVRNTEAVQDRLAREAARIVKQKAEQDQKLLGIRFSGPAQVYAERPSTYYPSDMYDSYVAAESENVESGYYRQKYTVQNARKSRTFYYNGLDASGFDFVVNPVITEPVVQFTLYLKVRYQIANGNGASPKKGTVSAVRSPARHLK